MVATVVAGNGVAVVKDNYDYWSLSLKNIEYLVNKKKKELKVQRIFK